MNVADSLRVASALEELGYTPINALRMRMLLC